MPIGLGPMLLAERGIGLFLCIAPKKNRVIKRITYCLPDIFRFITFVDN